MSGDGNDEEIVKLSIEGKVMMALMITTVMMMKMTSTIMVKCMSVCLYVTFLLIFVSRNGRKVFSHF